MPAARNKNLRVARVPFGARNTSSSNRPNLTSSTPLLNPTINKSSTTLDKTPPALPTEILEQIARHLSGNHSTWYSGCLVSNTFYQIGFPVLSRHLRLSPWKKEPNERGESVLDPKKQQVGRLSGKKKTRSDSPFDTLRTPENVRILTIREHPSHWCDQGTEVPLPLPNLRSLHLHFELHPDFADYMILTPLHLDCKAWGRCRFLPDLHPRNLVIHYSFNSRLFDRMWRYDEFVSTEWASMEMLIIVTPSTDAGIQCIYNFMQRLQDFGLSLKRIYWICNASDPTVASPDGGSPRQGRPGYHPGIRSLARTIDEYHLTVVNVDTTCKHTPNPDDVSWATPAAEVVQMLTDEVKKHYPPGSTSQKARLDSIELISLDEYLRREEWWDIFEPAEIEQWLKNSK
ncbi:hypothetical protein I316_05802 [Kwoniella heveanensis BCC8398]|uniref:F-box domain-containing protein n=1 Tax=Kwoniella heveanensis BCC8398 TaxID=1296120 RepID=A0A1B9GNJ0_9TREE|nr:hypothetical protein I316_05802 [Kwoniella heveanensis BCC8398]